MVDESEGTKFNMAVLFYKEILVPILQYKAISYTQGNYSDYLSAIEELYSNVRFKIRNKEQREEIESDLVSINKDIRKEHKLNRAISDLKKLEFHLLDLMYGEGMIFPSNKKINPLEEYKKRKKIGEFKEDES